MAGMLGTAVFLGGIAAAAYGVLRAAGWGRCLSCRQLCTPWGLYCSQHVRRSP